MKCGKPYGPPKELQGPPEGRGPPVEKHCSTPCNSKISVNPLVQKLLIEH